MNKIKAILIILLVAFVSCKQPAVKEVQIKTQKKESTISINIENSNGNSVSVAQNDTVISINDSLKH